MSFAQPVQHQPVQLQPVQHQAVRQPEPATAARPEAGQVPEIVHEVLAAAGRPLDEDTSARMRARFDTDFSRVRVHSDGRGAESARAVSARAYTVGRHIVFAEGSYAPHTATGRHLLTHELTHVVQQGQVDPGRHLRMTSPGDAAEVHAARIASGHQGVTRAAGGPVLARTPDTDLLDRPRPAQPSIGPGRLGEVVMHLPDWHFLPTRTFVHPLLDYAANATLLEALVVPELGVVLKVDGNAHARAELGGSYDGWLHNITVGLSEEEAGSVRRFELFGNAGQDQQSNRDLDDVAGIVRNFSGRADLDVAGRIGGTVEPSAELSAAASVAGLFEVAGVRAGLTARAVAGAQLAFRDTVGIYNVDGKYHFQSHPALTLTVPLRFDLTAFLAANLLGAHWRDDWQLAQYARDWEFGANLDVRFDNTGSRASTVTMSKRDTDIIALVHDLLTTARSTTHLAPATGAPTGPAGPSGPGAPSGPGGPKPPTGRSPSTPIPMGWYKSPARYRALVLDDGLARYLGRPSWVTVPDRGSGLADVRRRATDRGNGERALLIGVAPGSRNYPQLGGRPWQRVSASYRGETTQRGFRALLRERGCAWGSEEADHVRDLQWSGTDDYDNMWPLNRADNGAANDAVLSQPVTYTDATGAARTVPIRQTPLGLYFQIVYYM